MVDARVEAKLAQEQHTFTARIAGQVADRLIAIGDREHVPAVRDTVPGHQVLKHGRQHVDDDVRPRNCRGPHRLVVDVEENRLPARVPGDAFLGCPAVQVTYRDEPVAPFSQLEQAVNQVGRALPGAKNEYTLHASAKCRLWRTRKVTGRARAA